MEAMAADCRAYAFDFWGFGDSAKSRPLYNIVSYARLLNDLMDEMGIPKASIVGHSVGGAIALIYASRCPERVERLAVANSPVEASAINGRLRSFSNPLASQLIWRPDAASSIKRLLGSFKINHAEVNDEASKADPDAISDSMRSLAAMDLREELRHVRVPILAVFGSEDPVVNVSQASFFEVTSRHARSIVLDGSRHFPMLEEPAKFHRLLRDFLVEDEDVKSLQIKEMWHRRTH